MSHLANESLLFLLLTQGIGKRLQKKNIEKGEIIIFQFSFLIFNCIFKRGDYI